MRLLATKSSNVSHGFAQFEGRLGETIRSLPQAEALRRAKLEALALLILVEDRVPESLKEVAKAARLHWEGGRSQGELLRNYDAEVLAPMWRSKFERDEWRGSLEFVIVVLLTALTDVEPIDPTESPFIANRLASLGIPEDELVTAYETVHPELKGLFRASGAD